MAARDDYGIVSPSPPPPLDAWNRDERVRWETGSMEKLLFFFFLMFSNECFFGDEEESNL